MPFCAIAPLRIIMKYQEVWRTQALIISGLDLQRCSKGTINTRLIIKATSWSWVLTACKHIAYELPLSVSTADVPLSSLTS